MDIQELENYNLADAVKFHNQLNPKIWEGQKMRPEVQAALLRIAQDFREFMGITDLALDDIRISGSNAAYSYTDHSDIDLHLIVDINKLDPSEVFKELFDAKKYQYNDQHNIKIRGYDVELYVQPTDQTHVSLGEFSIKDSRWIRIPSRQRTNLDDTATRNKYEKLKHVVELAINSNNIKTVAHVIDILKKYRRAGLDQHGEFGPENLSYKMLRTQGLVQKLFDRRNELDDSELSLEAKHKKSKKKFKYGRFGGIWYPGYNYFGQHQDNSNSDSGVGEQVSENVNSLGLKYDELYLRYYKKSYREAEKQGLTGLDAEKYAKNKLDQYKTKVKSGEIDPISKTKWWKDQQKISAGKDDFWRNFGQQRNIEESVAFDNSNGIGAVPLNTNVDYRGLRVFINPRTYLALAKPMSDDNSDKTTIAWLVQQLQQGRAFGSPFFDISIPIEWEDNDFSSPAKIVGHDGRHRMAAILEVYGNDPVEVHLFPRYYRNHNMTAKWIAALNQHVVSEHHRLVTGPWFRVA